MKWHVCSATSARVFYTTCALSRPIISFMRFYDFIFFGSILFFTQFHAPKKHCRRSQSSRIDFMMDLRKIYSTVVRELQKRCDKIEFSPWNHISRRKNGNAKQYQRLTSKWRLPFYGGRFFPLASVRPHQKLTKTEIFMLRNVKWARENWVKQHAAMARNEYIAWSATETLMRVLHSIVEV